MTPFWAGFEKRAGILGAVAKAIPGKGIAGKAMGGLGGAFTGADVLNAAKQGSRSATGNKDLWRNMADAAAPVRTM